MTTAETPPAAPTRSLGGILEIMFAGAVVILAAATMAGYIGALAWWLDLFSHFRVHLVAACVVVAVVAVMIKRVRWAVLAMMLAGANVMAIAPHMGDGSAAAEDRPARGLKIVHFNVHNMRLRYDDLVAFLKAEDADVVALAEVVAARRGEMDVLRAVYPYRAIGEPTVFRGPELDPAKEPNGLVILSKQPLLRVQSLDVIDASHPWGLRFAIDVSGRPVTIYAVHLAKPLLAGNAAIQAGELSALAALVRAEPGPVAIIGDLNLTPYAKRYQAFIRNSGTRRAVRGITPTWPTEIGLLGIPIDHALLRGIDGRFQVGPVVGSDHRPLIGHVTF